MTALKAVASLLANVLARTLAEGALDDTVRELATVFNGAPVPLLLLDRFGTVLRANQSANDMLAAAPTSLAGSNALERIHPDDPRRPHRSGRRCCARTDRTAAPRRSAS